MQAMCAYPKVERRNALRTARTLFTQTSVLKHVAVSLVAVDALLDALTSLDRTVAYFKNAQSCNTTTSHLYKPVPPAMAACTAVTLESASASAMSASANTFV